jgi:hypothetical protein
MVWPSFSRDTKGIVTKNFATLLAAASSAPATPPPTASGGSGSAPPSASPSSKPASPPKPSASQVIMIDPDGKKYTRKRMIQMAAGMATVMGKNLPSDFCARSYKEGVAKGGKFPAGKAAFMEACEEGVSLGS